MSIVGDNSIFIAMKQNGPFGVSDYLGGDHLFDAHARSWVKRFASVPVTATKYRAVRTQIFELLDVQNYQQIRQLIHRPSEIIRRSERAYRLLSNLYGISGNLSEIKNRIHEYAVSADEVISYLKQNVLKDYQSSIEISNEIETTQNPVELLLIIFNDRYHRKARFEAKRKLVLMGLAASIDQRERETGIASKFSDFLDFLNQHVWSPHLKIGELKTAYLHSFHDANDFHCRRVSVLDEASVIDMHQAVEGEKLTLIKRRLFHCQGKDIPVYVTVRKKDSAAKILKLLRKNEKNPAVAVDDELGLMAVLDTTADVKRFIRHLTQAAVTADSVMVLEDISDTLTGGSYAATSVGSSQQTPMLKFFARLGGMRVEFIIHTNETYLNYRYQQGIAHAEYEVRRLFDSGVAEFLFPTDIYNLDMIRIRQVQLEKFRQAIET